MPITFYHIIAADMRACVCVNIYTHSIERARTVQTLTENMCSHSRRHAAALYTMFSHIIFDYKYYKILRLTGRSIYAAVRVQTIYMCVRASAVHACSRHSLAIRLTYGRHVIWY